MEFLPDTKVSKIRDSLDHPIIDSDGHAIEYLPLVRDILRDQAGLDAVAGLQRIMNGAKATWGRTPEQMRAAGMLRASWWGFPARNSLDRATALLPGLLYERLPELGVDHAVVYPTYGLAVMGNDDDDLRRALVRAFNTFYAEAFRGYGDRLTPVGIIPMHTPDEAIVELEHATKVLGLKAFVFGGPIGRPVPGVDPPTRAARWLDTLGLDSIYDYDPVWARCVQLGVAPTFHSASMGWGSRVSISSYVYNHIGMFATANEALARSLFLGGVPQRFPQLRFAFLEGGVAWACSLYSDLLSHWEKRNRDAVEHYNPAHIDRALISALFESHGSDRFRERLVDLEEGLTAFSFPDEDPSRRDEFAACAIDGPEDIRDVFCEQFFFGCEADDPLTSLAFDRAKLPLAARLKPLFASDIGHWDVPDARDVLPEAWELVERGLLDSADFRSFAFDNAVSLWASGNPGFFDSTSVGEAVKHALHTSP